MRQLPDKTLGRRDDSEAEDEERLAMCAVVCAKGEKDGSTEAPSAASEFPPSHGAVREEATDQCVRELRRARQFFNRRCQRRPVERIG